MPYEEFCQMYVGATNDSHQSTTNIAKDKLASSDKRDQTSKLPTFDIDENALKIGSVLMAYLAVKQLF